MHTHPRETLSSYSNIVLSNTTRIARLAFTHDVVFTDFFQAPTGRDLEHVEHWTATTQSFSENRGI